MDESGEQGDRRKGLKYVERKEADKFQRLFPSARDRLIVKPSLPDNLSARVRPHDTRLYA